MTLADSHGFFPIVVRPMPLPVDYAVSDVDRMIRFNHAWTPYVLGVLGLLTRPEVYDGTTRAEYAFAIGEGQNIYNALEEIPVEASPLRVEVSTTSTNGAENWTVNDPYSSAYVREALIADDLDGATSLSITVRRVADSSPAGGLLTVEFNYLPVASKAYTVTGTSCSGSISESGFMTDGLHFFSWADAKTVTISISAVYCVHARVSVDGQPVCEEA
jgi:hypothetical protein